MKLALLLEKAVPILLAAPLLFSQTAVESVKHSVISGLVLETGTNQPIVDAELSLEYYGPEQPRRMPSPTKATLKTQSDASGAFSFVLDELGYYIIRARREGYAAAGSGPGGQTSSRNIMLTKREPAREIRLFLTRPATLTGLVVDADTGEPIAGQHVTAARVMYSNGRRMFRGAPGTTDSRGEFAIPDLTPGEYVTIILPDPIRALKERLLTRLSDGDSKVVDQDYEMTYWPGGHGADAAIPVLVGPGATVSVGRIATTKVPYYRVLVHMVCAPGDSLEVSEFFQDGQRSNVNGIGQVPCGPDVIVKGFRPGSYRMLFVRSREAASPETREMGSVPFAVVDENVEITAAMARPTTVDGVVLAAEGARLPDIGKIQIRLDPINLVNFSDLNAPASPKEDGKFRLLAFTVQNQRVAVSGVGPNAYVKEVRYNGAPINGSIVPFETGSSHTLTVVIDDKPATIMGVVKFGDKPAPSPYVVLVKWPPPADQPIIFADFLGAGDDTGAFQFSGLAPGEYRIVALRSGDEYRSRAPGTLEHALAAAEKIQLGPSSFQDIALEITELR